MRSTLLVVLTFLLAACSSGGEAGPACHTAEFGCSCASDLEPDEGIACAAADQGDDGFCCASTVGDSDACYCVRPACAFSNDDSGFCSCGADLYDDTETHIDSCQPAPGDHCCLAVAGPLGAQCFCSVSECLASDVEVSSCTTARVAACGDSAELTDSCE
jgi:hypothetical protein